MDVEELLDRHAIFDCLTRFSRGMDRYDRELALSAFHADAVCDYGPYVGSPDGLFDWALRLRASLVSTHHHLSNHSCELDREAAHAETYLLYSARRSDDSIWQAQGRYLDRLEKRAGRWGISTRYCVIESMGQIGRCELPVVDVADLHANGAPAQDRSDPSYRRPLVNRRALRALP